MLLEWLEERTLLSTLDVTGTTLSYTAAAGETNTVSLSSAGSGASYTIIDPGAAGGVIGLTAGATARGCVVVGTTATCPASVNSIVMDLGNMDDSLTFANALVSGASATVGGGSGTNTLVGNDFDTQWNINLTNAGHIHNVNDIDFSSFQNLMGNSRKDIFIFGPGTSVDGTVDAGAGGAVDTLDFSNYGTSITVNLNVSSVVSDLGPPHPIFGGGAGGFANIDTIIGTGAATADTMIGVNAPNTWLITNHNAGKVTNPSAVNPAITFSSFENLTGGTDTDSFRFSNGTTVAGSIDGSFGSNTLDFAPYGAGRTITLTSPATLFGAGTGYMGTVMPTIGVGFDNIDTFVGSSAADDAIVSTTFVAHVFTVTSANAGTVDFIGLPPGFVTSSFSSVETLVGTDVFPNQFFFTNNLAKLTGSVVGGAGPDAVNYTGTTTPVTVDLETAKWTNVGGTVTGIEGLIGGDSTADKLTGENNPNLWSLASGCVADVLTGVPSFGADAGDIDATFCYRSMENLMGGVDDDTFLFNSGADVTGRVDGNGGQDTLDYSPLGSITVNRQTAAASHIFGAAPGGFSSIEHLIGSDGSDTLIGQNILNNWNITGSNSGNIGGTFTWDSVESLTGGTNVDNFIFANPAAFQSGVVSGAGGQDKLNYAAFGLAVTVNRETSTATGIGGTYASIECIIGSSAVDTLIAANVANTWHVTNVNAGDIGSPSAFSFVGIENVTGGTASDTWIFSNGAKVTGALSGGLGGSTDTLDYSAYTSGRNVTLTGNNPGQGLMGTEPGSIGGGFSNIDNIAGSNASDKLTSTLAGGTTFTLASAGGGTAVGGGPTLTFTKFDSLMGGAGPDAFIFSTNAASVSGTIDGAGGTDTLSYAGSSSPVTVNLDTRAASRIRGGAAAGFTSIENLVGSTGVDKLIGANTTNTWHVTALNAGDIMGVITFSAIEKLCGGSGADTWIFSAGAGVTGTIDGGPGFGNDSFDYSAYTTAVTVNTTTGVATGVAGGMIGIENFKGGSATDSFTVHALPGLPRTITGSGADTLTVMTLGQTFVRNNAANTIKVAGLGTITWVGIADGNVTTV